MARKFFIAAGHGANDPGTISANGLDEREVAIKTVDRIFSLLKGQETLGWEFVKVPHELDLQGEINWINNQNPAVDDVCIDVHMNAGAADARGNLVIIGNNDTGKRLGKPFTEELAKAIGVPTRGYYWNESKQFFNAAGQVVQTGFGFINFTKPLAAIVELDFLSNRVVADQLKSGELYDKFSQGFVRAAMMYIGSTYNIPISYTPPPQLPAEIEIDIPLANMRELPDPASKKVGMLSKGQKFVPEQLVAGKFVSGNNKWWQLKGQLVYIWTGATKQKDLITFPKVESPAYSQLQSEAEALGLLRQAKDLLRESQPNKQVMILIDFYKKYALLVNDSENGRG